MLIYDEMMKCTGIQYLKEGDIVLVPLKQYYKFDHGDIISCGSLDGIEYFEAVVTDICKDIKYVDGYFPRGIYEVLNDKIHVIVKLTGEVVCGIHCSDILLAKTDERDKLIKDYSNIFIGTELYKHSDVLVRYNLLYNEEQLHYFSVGEELELSFNNPTSNITFKSIISNIESHFNDIYLTFNIPSEVDICELNKCLNHREHISLNSGDLASITINMNSNYIVENLNYILMTENNTPLYFNRLEFILEEIIETIIKPTPKIVKIGLHNFNLSHTVTDQVDDKNFNIVAIYTTHLNTNITYRKTIGTIITNTPQTAHSLETLKYFHVLSIG